MDAFAYQDVSNSGNRGRPPYPRETDYRHELVLDAKGNELGELVMEPQADGTVLLTALVDGKEKTLVFGAPKARKPRKAKAAA